MAQRSYATSQQSYRRLPERKEAPRLYSPAARPAGCSSRGARPGPSILSSARPSTSPGTRANDFVPRALSLTGPSRTSRAAGLDRPWLAAPPSRGILRLSGFSSRGTARRVRFDEASIRLSRRSGVGRDSHVAFALHEADYAHALAGPHAAAVPRQPRCATTWSEDPMWFARHFAPAAPGRAAEPHDGPGRILMHRGEDFATATRLISPKQPRPPVERHLSVPNTFFTSLPANEHLLLRALVSVNERKLMGCGDSGSPPPPRRQAKMAW